MEERYTGVDKERIVIWQQFVNEQIGGLVENETKNDRNQLCVVVN